MTASSCSPRAAGSDQPEPFLCMRLMYSQDPTEVEAVKTELLRAGIMVETRNNPVAESMGVTGMELWVLDERDFFEATRLFARMQDDPGATLPKTEAPGQVGSLLKLQIDQILRREQELAARCTTLQSRNRELERALVEVRQAAVRETEERERTAAAHAEKTARLQSVLECERAGRAFAEEKLCTERHAAEQELQTREQSILQIRKELDSVSRLLQAERSAAAELRKEIAALSQEREGSRKLLSDIRAEAEREKQARLSAEARALEAAENQRNLAQRLREQAEIEHSLQAHLASMNSLCSRMQTKRDPAQP